MFIAMNRFKVSLGKENEFEEVVAYTLKQIQHGKIKRLLMTGLTRTRLNKCTLKPGKQKVYILGTLTLKGLKSFYSLGGLVVFFVTSVSSSRLNSPSMISPSNASSRLSC